MELIIGMIVLIIIAVIMTKIGSWLREPYDDEFIESDKNPNQHVGDSGGGDYSDPLHHE